MSAILQRCDHGFQSKKTKHRELNIKSKKVILAGAFCQPLANLTTNVNGQLLGFRVFVSCQLFSLLIYLLLFFCHFLVVS